MQQWQKERAKRGTAIAAGTGESGRRRRTRPHPIVRQRPQRPEHPRAKLVGLLGLTVLAVTAPLSAWPVWVACAAVLVAVAARRPRRPAADLAPGAADPAAGAVRRGLRAVRARRRGRRVAWGRSTVTREGPRGVALGVGQGDDRHRLGGPARRDDRLPAGAARPGGPAGAAHPHLIAAFMYRYLFVIVDEVQRMRAARDARGYRPRSMFGAGAAGRIASALFLRTHARGERVYLAMLSRGYDGRMRHLVPLTFGRADALFVATVALVLLPSARSTCPAPSTRTASATATRTGTALDGVDLHVRTASGSPSWAQRRRQDHPHAAAERAANGRGRAEVAGRAGRAQDAARRAVVRRPDFPGPA